MRGCGIRTVGQKSLWIGAIILVLVRLRDGDTVKSDVTLTEQREEEITSHDCGVRQVHIET